MKRFERAFAYVLIAAAAWSQVPQDSDVYVSPASEHRIFFAQGDSSFATLLAMGAVLRVEDYGSFSLGVVDERKVGGRSALLALGLDIRDDQAVIGFNGAPLDTADRDGLAARLDAIPAFLRASDVASTADSLWIVQFVGPIRDAWLARLGAMGCAIVSPMATNAYIVAVPAAALPAFAALENDAAIQWIGPYHPWFRIAPELRRLDFASPASIDVTVQLIAGDAAARMERALSRFPSVRPVETVLGYVNVRVSIPISMIPGLVADPCVFAIEPVGVMRLLDEAQCQIVAGSLGVGNVAPTGPGYLAWLASKGFQQSGQFNFAIDVTDSGIDRGSTTDVNDEFKVLGFGGISRVVFAYNYTNDPLGDCANGHGNLNVSIAGGYNALVGTAYEDASGFDYGLGICPFVQLGSSKVFSNASVPDFLQPTSFRLGAAYNAGARISNNSWGATAGNGYDADCQAHDALTRDATTTSGGNQALVIVFAAGNDGNGANTVRPPTTSKNVITVGASENFRQTGTDGCTVPNTGANNAMDIINFSSRGPCADLRKKPDIMAPGTHVQGAMSRSLTYNAGAICNFAWPLGSTLYTWASGTSFSAPAVAGACALVRQYFINHGWPIPSPAMTKALLMNTTRYMTGVGANDSLWSNNQGMGLVDIGRTFDGASAILEDQTHVFGATGQTYSLTGTIASSTTPFRVALVWSDPPGPITGNAYVNNLDLQVTVNTTVYKGNVFTGANSVTAGVADAKNNAEFVFLPSGTTGSFVVTVTATNIAGDGIPGNPDMTDQDFALVVYNGVACPPAITSLSPPSITPPLVAPAMITVTGSCFVPTSVVYANGVALPTTFVNATSLTCTLSPSIPQTQILGAVCINVQNFLTDASNSVALVCGSGNNAGTIRRQPLAPALGTLYALVVEGGVPLAPFSLFGDLGTVTPIGGFPDPVSNFVLALSGATGSAGPLVPVLDGLGIFGTPIPVAFDAAGKFVLPGIYLPNPPAGLNATLQVAYLDPTSPIGLRLTWAKFPESL